MISARHVAEIALEGKRIGTPYNKLDCQALIEVLLSDAGVSRPNWRGSNHMWRDALTMKAALPKGNYDNGDYDNVPVGAWLFTLKNDGGEKRRGYYDNEGNACHVGMYLGKGIVIHSTTGGVQWDNIESARWTHYGLCRLLDYDEKTDDSAPHDYHDELISALEKLESAYINMKEVIAKWPN